MPSLPSNTTRDLLILQGIALPSLLILQGTRHTHLQLSATRLLSGVTLSAALLERVGGARTARIVLGERNQPPFASHRLLLTVRLPQRWTDPALTCDIKSARPTQRDANSEMLWTGPSGWTQDDLLSED